MDNFDFLSLHEEQCLSFILLQLKQSKEIFYSFTEKELNANGLRLEDVFSLCQKRYIEGQFYDNSTRGLLSLTATGKDYFDAKDKFVDSKKKEERKQKFNYWIPIVIANLISIASLIVSIVK